MVKKIIDIDFVIREEISRLTEAGEEEADETNPEAEDAPEEDSPEDDGGGDEPPKNTSPKKIDKKDNNDLKEPENNEPEEEEAFSFYDIFKEYTEDFKEHFEAFGEILDEKSLFRDNAGIISFPTNNGYAFEMLFLDNDDSDEEEAFVKTFVKKNGKHYKLEDIRFPKKDADSYINSPESLFPSRKISEIFGK